MGSPYPFSAVVGLADLRLALLLNAVSPVIGGVLVRGEKGTAKSTMVRALAALLPGIDVSPGCRFACDPAAPDTACPDAPHEAGHDTRRARLVELPVGATEDRLIGSLDLERALTHGRAHFEPGLLAAAHRGVLYVDEVNLLQDHLVDLLLDAAAMGRAHVERDGVSVHHAASFLLVGTMNPEEGELRPQLLDRFGLAVQVSAPRDPAERAEVVRRRLSYEAGPQAFATLWAGAEQRLAERIRAARGLVSEVELPDGELLRIAHICAAFDVDGMRADIVVARTARALAAWHGRTVVTGGDVRDAARLALPHRKRRDPFDSPDLDQQALEEALHAGDTEPGVDQQALEEALRGGDTDPDDDPPPSGSAVPSHDEPAHPHKAKLFSVPGVGEGTGGRRSAAHTRTGRVVRAQAPQGRPAALHLAATLRAAAPHQHARGRDGAGPVRLRPGDLREPVRRGREANLVLFCVDASGSMAARKRMGAVKTAVLSLLLDAYQRRDKVGLVTFRGEQAELVLPPTSAVQTGAARLRQLATGGRTPLADGLRRARKTLRAERRRDPQRRALLIVVTDGRATAGSDPVPEAMRAARELHDVATVVVDCESGRVRLGLARELAAVLGADYVALDEVSARDLRRVAGRAA